MYRKLQEKAVKKKKYTVILKMLIINTLCYVLLSNKRTVAEKANQL